MAIESKNQGRVWLVRAALAVLVALTAWAPLSHWAVCTVLSLRLETDEAPDRCRLEWSYRSGRRDAARAIDTARPTMAQQSPVAPGSFRLEQRLPRSPIHNLRLRCERARSPIRFEGLALRHSVFGIPVTTRALTPQAGEGCRAQEAVRDGRGVFVPTGPVSVILLASEPQAEAVVHLVGIVILLAGLVAAGLLLTPLARWIARAEPACGWAPEAGGALDAATAGSRYPRYGWLPLLALPLAAHLAFSPLGFNPTDDGFILAIARRILEGQLPHRDFISVRPVGSAYLHSLELLLGGEHAYTLGRLIFWLQLGAIAYSWIGVLERAAGRRFRAGEYAGLSVLGIVFGAHQFPVMPWHTLDGVFFCSLGCWAVAAQRRARLGYLLIGAAALCKQNFLAMGPAALLLGGHVLRPACWLAWAAPAAAYSGLLWLGGGLEDARVQLTALAPQLSQFGLHNYLNSRPFWLGLVVGVLSALLTRVAEVRARDEVPAAGAPLLGALLMVCAGLMVEGINFPHGLALGFALAWYLAISLAGQGVPAWRLLAGAPPVVMLLLIGLRPKLLPGGFSHAAFAMFGATLAVAGCHLVFRGVRDWTARAGLAVAALGWCSAISMSYYFPALAAGAAAIYLAAGCLSRSAAASAPPSLAGAGVLALAGVCLAAWIPSRLVYLYREAPFTARELTERLDGVLPGGAGLRTNPTTFRVLSDLSAAVAAAESDRVCILPDAPGWYAASEEHNPLPIVWAIPLEIPDPRLLNRILRAVEAERGRTTFVLARFELGCVAGGWIPSAPNSVMEHIRHSFVRIGQTEFFELYR